MVNAAVEWRVSAHAVRWLLKWLCGGCSVGSAGDAWAVRSKAALLLALVAKRQGALLVEQLLPRLLPLAQQSPAHAEMVPVLPSLAMCSLMYTGNIFATPRSAFDSKHTSSLGSRNGVNFDGSSHF